MVCVWRKAHLFDPQKATASTWIFTIARNLRIDAYRREKRPELDPEDPALQISAPEDAMTKLSAEQNATHLAQALGELNPADRHLLELAYYDDKSQSQIAAELGLPLGTIKSRMRQIYGKLRKSPRNSRKRHAMSLSHHVSDELVMAYEAGSLAEGWSLAVATHLSYCPECRDRARAATAVGGVLLDAIETASITDSTFDEILARIEVSLDRARPRLKPNQPATKATVPSPLRAYIGADLDVIPWKRIGTAGHQALIPTSDRETLVRLLRIPAGSPVPEHGHRGLELTVVLRGTLVDGDERFASVRSRKPIPDIEHTPCAGTEEDCICLAVTDAPLRFRSLIVRLVQPFLGI